MPATQPADYLREAAHAGGVTSLQLPAKKWPPLYITENCPWANALGMWITSTCHIATLRKPSTFTTSRTSKSGLKAEPSNKTSLSSDNLSRQHEFTVKALPTNISLNIYHITLILNFKLRLLWLKLLPRSILGVGPSYSLSHRFSSLIYFFSY